MYSSLNNRTVFLLVCYLKILRLKYIEMNSRNKLLLVFCMPVNLKSIRKERTWIEGV